MKTIVNGKIVESGSFILGGGASAGGVPVGTIVIWSGTADNIPAGWQLCDGTNGTPDLRDKFVLGAGAAHEVGETGGSEEVTLTVAQMPSHAHVVSGMIGAATKITPSTTGKSDAPHYTSYNTANSGSSQPHPNMPPYYALCYIMKLTADATDGVLSINGEAGAITLAAGDNVSITKTGKTITISAAGGGPSLQSLTITTPPNKTRYKAGENFDPTGMEVYASFSDDSGIYVDKPSLTFDPDGQLSTDDAFVEVSFSFGGKTATAEQPVKTKYATWSPEMTSDTSPSPFVVSAAGYFDSSTPPWQAFDDNENTTWAGTADQNWIMFDFGSPVLIDGISMLPEAEFQVLMDQFPKSGMIQGSVDGNTWSILAYLDETLPKPTAQEYRDTIFEGTISPYRYYKLSNLSSYDTTNGYIGISNIRFIRYATGMTPEGEENAQQEI